VSGVEKSVLCFSCGKMEGKCVCGFEMSVLCVN
jgi:hypothetical protein